MLSARYKYATLLKASEKEWRQVNEIFSELKVGIVEKVQVISSDTSVM